MACSARRWPDSPGRTMTKIPRVSAERRRGPSVVSPCEERHVPSEVMVSEGAPARQMCEPRSIGFRTWSSARPAPRACSTWATTGRTTIRFKWTVTGSCGTAASCGVPTWIAGSSSGSRAWRTSRASTVTLTSTSCGHTELDDRLRCASAGHRRTPRPHRLVGSARRASHASRWPGGLSRNLRGPGLRPVVRRSPHLPDAHRPVSPSRPRPRRGDPRTTAGRRRDRRRGGVRRGSGTPRRS